MRSGVGLIFAIKMTQKQDRDKCPAEREREQFVCRRRPPIRIGRLAVELLHNDGCGPIEAFLDVPEALVDAFVLGGEIHAPLFKGVKEPACFGVQNEDRPLLSILVEVQAHRESL
jgi:hypothetical protein